MLPALLASLAAMTGTMEDNPQSASAPDTEHPAVTPSGPDPVYPAAFYAPFQPPTALDMLERTPGFTLVEGGWVRGFGGAAGNVLVGGQRPTVKSGGITEILRRIPAAQVERIVLLRGSEAAEAQGQVLVANVILKADAAGSGNASLALARTPDGRVSPSAKISYAKALGAWQTSIELSGEIARYPYDRRTHVRDAGGTLTQTRIERYDGRAPELGLAASASGPMAGGTLTLNVRLNRDGYRSDQHSDLFVGEAAGTPSAIRTITYQEKGASGELGADWTRGLERGWTTKLVGLARIERFDQDEDYAEPGYRGVSALRQKPMELVARATVSREGDHAVRPELGIELAYNRLTSALDYTEDTGSGLVRVPLSNADTRVAELRGEAFANVTVRLAPTLALEAGAAFELSRIRVDGDGMMEQKLSYLKPSAALVWSPSGSTQLRVGYRRTVDQLDFGDFAASVDQADGRPMGGKSRLRPARMTRVLARLDHRWGKGGALAIEGFHQWHDGLLGYLLLPTGDEALGTIGNGRQWGVTASATLPLGAILPGARLTTDGTLRASRFRDPLTGENRDMDGIAPRTLSAEFRHDLPRLRSSWGVTFTAASTKDYFYNREIWSARTGATWGAYVETTALRGFKATLKATGIGGQDDYRLRRFHAPTRAGGFAGSEERDQHQGATVSLTLSRAI